MSAPTRRQPKGIRTGGQFAATGRGEVDVEVDTSASVQELRQRAVDAMVDRHGPDAEGPARANVERLTDKALPLYVVLAENPASHLPPESLNDLAARGFGEAEVLEMASYRWSRHRPLHSVLNRSDVTPERFRMIQDRLIPIVDHLDPNDHWAREAIWESPDPAALADRLEDAPPRERARILYLDAHPERAERLAEADAHSITDPVVIQLPTDLAQVRRVADAIDVPEREAMEVVRRGFSPESARYFGKRLARSARLDQRDINRLENNGLRRADIKAAMSVFPYEEAERVAQIVEARPGSKVSDIRRYAAVVEESHANLSADKVAYLMSTLSLDKIDAYPGAVSSSSDVEGNAQAVRTLIDAGYLSSEQLDERLEGAIEALAEHNRRGTAARLRAAAATVHLTDQRMRELSRAGVPQDEMASISADQDAWTAGAKFREEYAEARRRGLVSRYCPDEWPWNEQTYRTEER
ncbi:hypothetical protein ACTXI9_17920 [Brachybacterium alimentarium]|uniref:hypothetical protein n=1 Tax=Brachybacterium alimentarium TaxID=47845 RepID=UPI003FD16E6D